ncbi:MAG: hypothetical protein ACKVQA_13585 [Burkholderiales bacterium]
MKMHPWCGLALVVGLMASSPSWGAERDIPVTKSCNATFLVENHDPRRLSLRLRAPCALGREQFKQIFAGLNPATLARDANHQEMSIGLGRVIEHPWLSVVLARAALNSREWDRKLGKPRQRNINQFAAALLRASGAFDKLVPGWVVQSASAEKVLVQTAGKMAALANNERALVPYDAIVWLHFLPDASSSQEAGTRAPAVNPPAKLEE